MRKIVFFVFIFHFTTLVFSQDYYQGLNVNSMNFVSDLKNRVRSPYTRIAYTNFAATNIDNYTSYDAGGGQRGVRCVYSFYEHTYTPPFSWGTMSREHTFCHSWMPTHPSTSTDEYADQHHLFPTHQNNANNRRSNHPLGIVVTPTYTFLEGKLGYNSVNQLVYEPRDDHKGDAARAILYMMIRYDGVSSNTWNFNWLNNTRLPALSEAPQNLNTLLGWHATDPPDGWEIGRNNYIYSIQENKNPFIDHPEYTDYINFNDLTYQTPNTNTAVYFSQAEASVKENEANFSIGISIHNPSVTLPCSVDVVLVLGNPADVNGFTSQRVVFPPNSNAVQYINLTIVDNNLREGGRVVMFDLQNITGGENAYISNPGSFSLNILDDDSRVYISEYSDAIGTNNYVYEFVELYNDSEQALNLSGYRIKQFNATWTYTIPDDTEISANGFLILARNSTKIDFETFWGVSFASNVAFLNSGGSSAPQINGDEVFGLVDPLNNRVDPFDSDASALALTTNNRVYRVGRNNTISDWASAAWTTATPGTLDAGSALPIELNSFSYIIKDNSIVLLWSTISEVNSYGFEVQRSFDNREWGTIGFIASNINSNSLKEYSFIDFIGLKGDYYYRLKLIDSDGTFKFSKILAVNTLFFDFNLEQNYPNPFNSETQITYSLPKEGMVILKIYDYLGNEVETLIEEIKPPGSYILKYNANDLSSGVYFMRLVSYEKSITRKIVLLK